MTDNINELYGVIEGMQFRIKEVEAEIADLKNEVLTVRVDIYSDKIEQGQKKLSKMINEDKRRCQA